MRSQSFHETWAQFWHTPLRAECLDSARVLFSAALLADQLFQYLPNLSVFFGPDGYAPAGVNDDYLLQTWRWTALFFTTDNVIVLHAAWTVWTATTLAYLVGWHTRVMGVFVWLLTMCFINRNPNLANGGDDTLQAALFFLMISPCGRSLSWDAYSRRKKLREGAESVIPAWPVRLLQLQLCLIYTTTGLAKLRGITWWDGTSIHYVLADVTMTRWPYPQLPLPLSLTAPLTYATLLFEVLFVPLVLWRPTRKWTLWFGVLLHVGIYLTIEVGWFSFYTLALYGPWIPQSWWARHFDRRAVRPNEAAGSVTATPRPDDYRVYYDTLCPVCRRSREMLQRLDLGGRLVFRDIHDRERMDREVPGVPYSRAMREMIVCTPRGQVVGGFDAFRALAWALPPLWPLIPLLYIPGASVVGRWLYRWVAKNRYRLVACENDICSLHLRALSKENLDEQEILRIVNEAKKAQPAAKSS